tara:strand:+ start:746 stop:1210 length:465 start_codon:yes stop_codon:yes gene_type:complete
MAFKKPGTKVKPKKPETLQDYVDQGWTVGPTVKLSYPPVYTLSKDGKTIQFRPKMKLKPNMPKRPKTTAPTKPGGVRGLARKAKEAIKNTITEKGKPLAKKAGGFAGRAGIAFSADNKLRRGLKKIADLDAKFKRQTKAKKAGRLAKRGYGKAR